MATAPTKPPWRRSSWQYGAGVTLAAAAAVAAPDGGPSGPGHPNHLLILGGATLGALLVFLLRQRPTWAVLASLAICTAAQLATGHPTGLVVLVLAALFVAGLRLPLGAAVAALTSSATVYLVVDVATGGWDSRVLAPVALMAATTGGGAVVSAQRALLRSAAERAAAAERSQQEQVEQRVADERLQIARELHDVVAHHVAVMGIQAGAAEQLLDTDRDQVREALAQIRSSGRTAITELSAVVGLLRSRTGTADHGGETVDLRPVGGGLDRLPDLVTAVRAAGLELTVTGQPHRPGEIGLSEMADFATYRIVQEALTNAMRHGTGSADLAFELSSTAVTVTVTNPVAAPTGSTAGARPGHGLLGMRERASLVDARLLVGAGPEGVFTVQVTLPLAAGHRP